MLENVVAGVGKFGTTSAMHESARKKDAQAFGAQGASSRQWGRDHRTSVDEPQHTPHT